MNEEVVITGLGVVSPIGNGEKAFWTALREGRSGAAPVTGFDTDALTRKIACQVREPVSVEEPMGRASKLAVAAAREAAASAQLNADAASDMRLDVVMGTTMGETEFIEHRLEVEADGWLSGDHAQEIARGRPGTIAQHVAADLGVKANATDLYGACAAGNMAIAVAHQRLRDGCCDVAIVGGADGFSQLAFIGFTRLRAMASEICRPFDEKRDGLLVGEGAAVLILERASDARARGANVRARILGCGLSCEDYHPTRPEPQGDGLTRATRAALVESGIGANEIDYVCAHGTGTPHNDAIEVAVMQQVFKQGVSFSSIKALTGHTMGAASAVEAVCCVLSLENQELIPTWHLANVLQPCDLDAIQGAPRPARVRHAINNSAGFGGYNSSVVLSAA